MIHLSGLRLSKENLQMLGGKDAVARCVYPKLTYDTALPEQWLQEYGPANRQAILTGTVWAYPEGSIFGEPLALSMEAWKAIHRPT